MEENAKTIAQMEKFNLEADVFPAMILNVKAASQTHQSVSLVILSSNWWIIPAMTAALNHTMLEPKTTAFDVGKDAQIVVEKKTATFAKLDFI